jgi:hypothetical protein
MGGIVARTAIPGGGGFPYFSVHPQDLRAIAARAAGMADVLGEVGGLVLETLWTAIAATGQPDLQNALIQTTQQWPPAIAARSNAIEKAANTLRATADHYSQVEVSVTAGFHRIGDGVTAV